MDQRTKNRYQEHKEHGWKEIERRKQVICFNGAPGAFMRCPCGWEGWIKI